MVLLGSQEHDTTDKKYEGYKSHGTPKTASTTFIILGINTYNSRHSFLYTFWTFIYAAYIEATGSSLYHSQDLGIWET